MKIRVYINSFRGKLTVLVASAALLPILITSAFLWKVRTDQLKAETLSRLDKVSKTLSVYVNHIQERLQTGVQRITYDNTLQVTLDLKIVPQLQKYLVQQQKGVQVESLTVYDSDKKIVATTSEVQFLGDLDQPGKIPENPVHR